MPRLRWLAVGLLILLSSSVRAPRPYGKGDHHSSRKSICDKSSCYPASGNLLIGREKRLWASSTCGMDKEEKYCIVSHLEEKKKCFRCDSRPKPGNENSFLSHRIENIVTHSHPVNPRKATWWQAENGKENVTIQLDLEAEFHFTHLIITFKTFRPAAMLIERSYDFGRTWKVYRYFAQNCDESFPGVSKDSQKTLTDVVCDSRYSSVAPSSDGEVILRVLPPNLHHLYDDPYSPDVQNLLKMTNLRINFTKLHTLGDDLLDNREEIQQKYYYAVREMVVRGSCSCYGHASKCLPQDGSEDLNPDMVHGKCECTHNTQGLNCEQCKDFYNDLPWKPAIEKQTNACKECNCNGHSRRCHFDQNVYEMTGYVSGGVCDGCMHNTVGRNCEQCMPQFFYDPIRNYNESDACQPCNCSPDGSIDGGICDGASKTSDDIIPGSCHCKANVMGLKCDSCKAGYWNYDPNNPEGCEKCTCNTMGTAGNEGCDVVTGDCVCKPFVVGKDCNQCIPEYWQLSESPEGCQPCNCDVGGSYDNNCDVITGQCRCRPHISGRTCSEPEQTYFSPDLDFLTYEAELANCTTENNCQMTIREPFRDGQKSTWTGTGFMRAHENTQLVFDIDNIKTSMDYDLVIRYEPQFPGQGEVKVTVEREEPVDPNGPCSNSRPQDDEKQVYMPAVTNNVVATPPVCLEAGKKYKVRLLFKHFGNQMEKPTASILVDSITLIPRVENIPFFVASPQNQHRLNEYDHYGCRDTFLYVSREKDDIPKICEQYNYNVGVYVFDGANSCNCDRTGSVSTLCDEHGGKCQCKTNVVGRTCNQCAPGTYGFGPEGCKACDCDSVGALDNFCDVHSGQCQCRAQTYGRSCDQCQPGSWNYPNCQRCHCNGHADTCHPHTGACTQCQAATMGHNCERCLDGYYGDPRLGIDIGCRPCPCPGSVESGHSYASRCTLDAQTQDVVCECHEGYAGSRCDVCADNYFGHPELVGGSCQSCNCSNNIDISRPGNCQPNTGECLNCLFNTEGFNCQYCKPNYYGDANTQSCKECVCDILGTDAKLGFCDRVTGQCPCLPNVIGQKCDQCKPNHWKIASGTGCEPCDCDPTGSDEEQCNQFDGQCTCKDGFGGRQCNQCQTNYWGDPNVQCHPCECNPEGSATLQCHQQNGTCVCMIGIGGAKCDQCARGYVGSSPQCSTCGECFDNWDSILSSLHDETVRVIDAAKEIKRTGASGAYTKEFEIMENHLKEVKQLLQNTTKSSIDLGTLENDVMAYRENFTDLIDDHDDVNKLLDNTTQRIYISNLALANLRNKTLFLENSAKSLKDNATLLQESNVEGALNLTREAQKSSQTIQRDGLEIQQKTANAERQCKRTENLVGRSSKQFLQAQKGNHETLEILSNELTRFEQEVPVLNLQVCGKNGDPCDSLCGGAGCGHCGGLGCDDGAVTKAEKALSFANDAQKHIHDKQSNAEELFRGISQAKDDIYATHQLTEAAYNTTLDVKEQSENAVNRSINVADKLESFLNAPRSTPAEIRHLATDVLSKNIQLKPEQIRDISRQINESISSRTDITTILDDTSDDLFQANERKREADQAKKSALKILEIARNVSNVLTDAKEAQSKAEQAIERASLDISSAKNDLTQTGSETQEAQQKANETVVQVSKLQDKLKTLQSEFLKNEKDAKEVAEGVKVVELKVENAQEKAAELKRAYYNANDTLQQRSQHFQLARVKAQETLEKANNLSYLTNRKLIDLKNAQTTFNEQMERLQNLSKQLDMMNSKMQQHLNSITVKSDYFRNCLN
ncbi:laminin subunit beta-1 isoform X2 [Nilaparvata lugens]|uniref:laminin subunit beta-1 isoform X2 n=1 Tax=Nilaparvata lugens TaxID=108931 RepID=UPI00193DF5B5|nr:laminin subunit beta-1 isoform X2 [Nilaparvata lugens]